MLQHNMQFVHKKLQEYIYLQPLGSGGQGNVVKVCDSSRRREYALKLLDNHRYLEFFKRESETLEKLNHNNIIEIYNSSFDEKEGEVFILMKYMQHGSIQDYVVKNKEIGLKQKLLLMQDAALGLKYAHQKGILHRDIKPQNIFVTSGVQGVYACLGDFGVAKNTMNETMSVTAAGMTTVKYLPLEILNEKEKQSEATDLYSLGMSMYEIITGEHAYDVSNMRSFFKSIEKGDITVPSVYVKSIPKELDDLCVKVIAKEKKDRYQSVEEFAKALEGCIAMIDDEPIIGVERSTLQEDKGSKNNLEVNSKDATTRKSIQKSESQQVKDAKQKEHKGWNNIVYGIADLVIRLGMYNFGLGLYKSLETEQNYEREIAIYERIAKLGNSKAMNHLGDMYYKLYEDNRDLIKAKEWYMEAAKLGNGEAMSKLGHMYEYGNGVRKDSEQAVLLYQKAIKQDGGGAMYFLGEMYLNGMIQEETYDYVEIYKKANELLLNAATKEDSRAVVIIGLSYYQGRGLFKDYTKAARWFDRSAREGNGVGKYYLGCAYENGHGVYQDIEKAYGLYQEAEKILLKNARREENAREYYVLGEIYYHGHGVSQNYSEAIRWYKKGAEFGNSDAMNSLGMVYYAGNGVVKDDVKAVGWYKKAALLNNSRGIVELGDMYYHGLGIEQDYDKAYGWYRKATELDDTNAMNKIGYMYENGCGMDRDYSKAIEWYRKAAELGGCSSAMNNLGIMYENGYGIDRDYAKAIGWYKKAAELGNSNAMGNIGILYIREGVEKDYSEAVKWLQRGAELGNTTTMVYLGVVCEKYYDIEKAIEWYEKAAELGNEEALHKIKDLESDGSFE